MEKPLLILCIDRDNDLYEKAKIHGPLIGREKNLEAAVKLSLIDPEDTDGNSIFYAIKLFDKYKKEKTPVEIVTLTGHKKMGITADMEISKQLTRILKEIPAESCIFVSDGASDEVILPVIRSRINIEAVKVVVVKQAKELEKTYFVILEKLKDPYYAKILLGLPAILILLFSLSMEFGWGWNPVGILVGLLLMIKGFGIDEYVGNIIKEFRFSIEKVSWVAYLCALALLVLDIWVGQQAYFNAHALGLDGVNVFAYILKSVFSLLTWILILVILGKVMDALIEKKKFLITRYATYMIAVFIASLVMGVGADWVINLTPPYVSFGDLLFTIVYSMFIGYVSVKIIEMIRTESILNMKLDGREIITKDGSFLGKVVGVDGKKEILVIQTHLGRKFNLGFKNISSIEESILLK
ncbi:DUF373 family protein [Candidatus Micrarchaeota archaeon]|nr:DUF373 family protein [Candidatus Micrarchaeota archaeon]